MRGFAVEAFAPVLFLEGPLGQADVGLGGGFALLERIHAALLLQYSLRTMVHHNLVVFFGAMI